jgi:hypothetical protein
MARQPGAVIMTLLCLAIGTLAWRRRALYLVIRAAVTSRTAAGGVCSLPLSVVMPVSMRGPVGGAALAYYKY